MSPLVVGVIGGSGTDLRKFFRRCSSPHAKGVEDWRSGSEAAGRRLFGARVRSCSAPDVEAAVAAGGRRGAVRGAALALLAAALALLALRLALGRVEQARQAHEARLEERRREAEERRAAAIAASRR